MSGNEERQTALHEAGHAAAGRVLGHNLGPVTIEEEETSLGETKTPAPSWVIDAEGHMNTDEPETRKYLKESVVIGLAAWWAVKIGTGMEDNEGAKHDLDQVDRYVQYLASWEDPRQQQRYWDEGHARCEKMMRENWSAVEAVARELLKKRALTPKEIADLFRDAT